MALDYLHNHPDFPELIRIVGEERSIVPALIEKDYWIMHCLYSLHMNKLMPIRLRSIMMNNLILLIF